LLTGICNHFYPLRTFINGIAGYNKSILSVLRHPGYTTSVSAITGDKYYKYLSSFRGAIATSAKRPIDYIVAKYFEIPACGCLPFFEEVPALSEMGFEAWKHYIPINKNTALSHFKLIKDDKYQAVATECRNFVEKNHSTVVRARQMLDIINQRL
jgi:hypothetical protein